MLRIVIKNGSKIEFKEVIDPGCIFEVKPFISVEFEKEKVEKVFKELKELAYKLLPEKCLMFKNDLIIIDSNIDNISRIDFAFKKLVIYTVVRRYVRKDYLMKLIVYLDIFDTQFWYRHIYMCSNDTQLLQRIAEAFKLVYLVDYVLNPK